jgi:hypothetical protein
VQRGGGGRRRRMEALRCLVLVSDVIRGK